MRTDAEYLKTLLNAFQNAKGPTTDLRELRKHGIDHGDPLFEFHLMQLKDQKLVTDDEDDNLGLLKSADGLNSWAEVPLRLTAAGNEFADALNNDTVMTKIKKDYVGTAVGTLWKVASAILTGEIKQHLGLL